MLECCNLCPRNCGVNRLAGEVGYCGCPKDMVIAKYSLHMWEEPCISGDNGSGTIFFSYCNMRCIFCQNYDISTLHKGRIVSIEEFSDICLKLQERGANNINLVTGTMYVPLIVKGIKLAKKKGLKIPVIYNTSSYENVDTIKMLKGIVDVYLPDLKYYSNSLGIKYSNCSNYFKYASSSIEEMFKQVGIPKYDKNGLIKKGVIVRHLMLPNNIEDSKKIIKYLYDKYKDDIVISIMNQYTPIRKLEYRELNNKVTKDDYDKLVNYAYDLGIRNAYIQDDETQDESFIPDFDTFTDL
jgi:putative pyruvate formate lyase activating enzyme